MDFISWGTPIYILALYGLVRFVISREQSEKPGINWNPLESIGVTLFIYFAGQVLGGLLVYLPLILAGWEEARITSLLTDNTLGQFLGVAVIQSIGVLLLIRFLRRRKSNLKAIGWFDRPRLKDFILALSGYGVYFVLYIIVVLLASKLVPSLNINQEQEIGFKNVTDLQLPLVFISLVVLPPLVEELLMRGFLYTSLKSKWPKIVAILVTSFIFAIAHLQAGSPAPLLWVAAIDTFVLSLVLIQLRDYTGKLWAPIMLHAIKNGVAFVALFVIAR